MRYKVTFAIGFAAGYTLGSRAGRERYEQISRAARSLAENPAVQSAAGMLQAQAANVVSNARQTVVSRITGQPAESSRDPYGPGPVPVLHGHSNGAQPAP
jgi:hypothetical protein